LTQLLIIDYLSLRQLEMIMTNIYHVVCWLFMSFLCFSCSSYKNQYEYSKVRERLIADHKSQSFSHDIVLDPREAHLNELLSDLQETSMKHYRETHYFPPARNFFGSKEHVETTETFKLLRAMPKGGALHIHTSAMGNLDWIINRARSTPEMYVYWSDDIPSDKGILHAYNIHSVPSGYVPADEVLSNEDNIEEFKSYFLFDQSVDQDSVDIWTRFEGVFKRIDGFVNYEKNFEDYITHGLSLLADDGVQHVELRMPFKNLLYSASTEARTTEIEEIAEIMRRVIKRIRERHPDFTLKIIHANLRFRSNELISSDMQTTLEFRQRYPDLLVGYDLVAEEDAGHSTLYHLESFLKLIQLNKKSAYPLNLYLHDGESNWVDNQNLYDAVLLGSKRIGHGFNLFRYPQLMEMVKKENICIEINPISNQVLGYIRDLRLHPAHTYLSQGIDISISSDDPLIFDYEGLSYDYWHVYMAWQLDLKDLKQLSKNGIIYSALSPSEKEIALKHWERRWHQFVNEALQKLDTHEN